MDTYTIKEENGEIQVLDGLGIKSLSTFLSSIVSLDIPEEEKQQKIYDKVVIHLKKPENLNVETDAKEIIKTENGVFYVLDKLESVNISNKNNDNVSIGLKIDGQTLISSNKISVEELSVKTNKLRFR